MQRSPRMVPGADCAGLVAPIMVLPPAGRDHCQCNESKQGSTRNIDAGCALKRLPATWTQQTTWGCLLQKCDAGVEAQIVWSQQGLALTLDDIKALPHHGHDWTAAGRKKVCLGSCPYHTTGAL